MGAGELSLTLFYSNPTIYAYEVQYDNTVNVIYFDWLVDMAKKMENLKIVFTFNREKEIDFSCDHPGIIYRKDRFFFNPEGKQERTLSKYHGNIKASFNPICGSSGFINGIVKRGDGRVERGRGIMQDLVDIEGLRSEQIDREQFYLQIEGATK